MSNVLTLLPKLQARKWGASREAFSYRDDALARWIPVSWADFEHQVEALARAFAQVGLSPGVKVAVFSPNSPQFLVTDFAAYRNRAVTVSIYSTSGAGQVRYILNDSGAMILLVGGAAQYAVARSVAAECPALKMIVVCGDAVPDPGDPLAVTFDDLIGQGLGASGSIALEVAARAAAAVPDDIATLIYTSGTTGEPKGAVLTHANFNEAIAMHVRRLDYLTEDDTSISFLPMSHIFEKAWTYFCLSRSMRVAVSHDPREIQRSLREVRPACMCSVPRFWEKAYGVIRRKMAEMSPLRKGIAARALAVGRHRNLGYVRFGRKVPRFLEWRYRFYEKLVITPVKRVMGVERGVIFPTAGAAIDPSIAEFFHCMGVNMVVGYGLSETTATVACFPNTGYVFGSVGTVLPDISVKLADNGEILVKGPTVMKEYYNKPEATAEAFTSDGWFRTGDAGYVDSGGNLFLTERIKDLFKTSNGKYIAPQAIESRLATDPMIEQVAVIGERRKFVSALIYPDYDVLARYARDHGIAFDTHRDLAGNQDIRDMVAARIEALQHGFAPFEKIKRFTLLADPFTMESGELTNTLKVHRSVVAEHYAPVIDAMYVD